MTAELTALHQIGIAKQPNAEGYTYGDDGRGWPTKFDATSDGAANGTTIVSTSLAAVSGISADSDLAGFCVEVIRCANGPSGEKGAPLRRRIKSYSHSGTALSIEALPFQVSEGDSFYLVKDPGAWLCEETGGSTTVITDSDRDAVLADFYNGAAEMGGPYAMVLTSGAISGQRLVSDDDGSTNVTTAAFGDSIEVGNLVELIQWIEVVGGVPLSFGHPRLDRQAVTGSLGKHRGVAGLQEVSGTLEMMFRGPGSSRVGDPAELDVILGAVTTATAAPADETIGSGCSETSVNVSGAPTAGSMWCTESGAVVVASNAADPFTPSPSIPSRDVPTAGETLYGLRTYTPAEAAVYCLKAWQWHGRGLVDELPGLLPTISFSGAMGEYLKASVGLTGPGGKRVYLDESAGAISRATALGAKLPTVVPRGLGYARVVMDGVEFEARSFSVDLGLKVEMETNLKLPDKRAAVLRGDEPTFQVDLFLDDDSKLLTVKQIEGKPMTMLIQVGTTPGDPGVWAFWAYEVELTAVEIGDDNGGITATVQGRVTLDTTTTLPRWEIGIG